MCINILMTVTWNLSECNTLLGCSTHHAKNVIRFCLKLEQKISHFAVTGLPEVPTGVIWSWWIWEFLCSIYKNIRRVSAVEPGVLGDTNLCSGVMIIHMWLQNKPSLVHLLGESCLHTNRKKKKRISGFSLPFLQQYYHFIPLKEKKMKWRPENMHMSSCPSCEISTWGASLLALSLSLSPLPAWESRRSFPSYSFSNLIMQGSACLSVFRECPFLTGGSHRHVRLWEMGTLAEAALMNYLKS